MVRYFNSKNNRKGPLWEGRFNRVLVENNDQLLHLTRYIHLNPSTDRLVENPIDWDFSSYKEYIDTHNKKICNFSDYMDIEVNSYKQFVNDRISYQKDLARIKHLELD